MALFINGVGQDTFSMNGVSIDNLYVDGVLVWSSYVNTKPVISIIGDNPMYLVLNGSAYVEQGATALDVEDGDISNDVVVGGDTPDVSVEGYYYVTYNVTDSEGLAADEQVRTVSVYAVTVPKYELTEALINDGTFDYVPDSNNPDSSYEGKLTESDGTTPYEPTALQYPRNGLLELDSGRIMDTQYTRAEADAQYGIYGADGSTVYNIWAIEYEITDHYHVWEGDQDTLIRVTYPSAYLPGIPSGSMTITDERPAFLPQPVDYPPVHISFRSSDTIIDPMPDGVSINTVYRNYGGGTMVDDNGDASSIYTVWDVGMNAAIADTQSSTDSNSGCVYDFQMNQAANTDATATLDIYLPSGTYTVRALSSYTNANPYDGLYTLGTYGEQAMNANTAGAANETCIEWTDVVGADGLIRLTIVKNGGSSYGALLNGLDIIRTA